jgi:hypothetical protein
MKKEKAMLRSKRVMLVLIGLLVALLGIGVAAQKGTNQPETPPERFEFAVIESFDAKYLGDTPGHRGRGGGLEGVTPNVALDDPVYRGQTKVGRITGIHWDRARSSLEIEFDPEPLQRVSVGEVVWISIVPPRPAP